MMIKNKNSKSKNNKKTNTKFSDMTVRVNQETKVKFKKIQDKLDINDQKALKMAIEFYYREVIENV